VPFSACLSGYDRYDEWGRLVGFSYRKSVKMGPFRMTASKSGISYSAGVKGARVTRRANGKVQTTLSVPGTGLRYTTTSGTRRKARRTARPSAPPATRRVAAPARPARLRGRRSTTSPQVPPAWLLPYTAKGYLAAVTVHQDGIHIERTRGGKLNGNHSSDIAWHDVVAIDFLAPNFIRNGHVHFATVSDPRTHINRPRQPHGRIRPQPPRAHVHLPAVRNLQAHPWHPGRRRPYAPRHACRPAGPANPPGTDADARPGAGTRTTTTPPTPAGGTAHDGRTTPSPFKADHCFAPSSLVS